jgi:hypothetical protein
LATAAAAAGGAFAAADWPFPPKSMGLKRNWAPQAAQVTCCPICVGNAGTAWLHCGQWKDRPMRDK